MLKQQQNLGQIFGKMLLSPPVALAAVHSKMSLVCLQFVLVIFPDRTHLLFCFSLGS